jgi:hypothetical protein
MTASMRGWSKEEPQELHVVWWGLTPNSVQLVQRTYYRRPPHDAKEYVWEIVGGERDGEAVTVFAWHVLQPPELPG